MVKKVYNAIYGKIIIENKVMKKIIDNSYSAPITIDAKTRTNVLSKYLTCSCFGGFSDVDTKVPFIEALVDTLETLLI